MRKTPLLLAVAIALLTGCARGDDGASITLGDWDRVEPGGETRCGRGGPYAFWIRQGDPEKLLVFFEGGGGCFDETTCAPGSPWFDDDVDDSDDPDLADGILALENPDNPFADYSMVFIPSCTGDVHMGTRTVKYGAHTVEQKGYLNATAALERAYADFPDASEVFVAGCSAGSVGSAFHVDSVLEQYPDARVAQAGDSLAFVFHRPVNLESWGTHDVFPEWFSPSRPNGRWTMVEYLTALAEQYPERTFARFNHAQDDVQMQFYWAVGGEPEDFPARLRAAEGELKKLPNYRSLLACGSEHCSFPGSSFYETETDGVRLRDWVADLAAGKDVDCPDCAGG